MVEYVKVQLTDELRNRTTELLEKSTKGKIRAGLNEVTKAIERGNAKFVVIAEDVAPKELVMHIPMLCDEKQIPYSYVATKKELGEKSGLGTSTSAVAIIQCDVEAELKELARKISELKK